MSSSIIRALAFFGHGLKLDKKSIDNGLEIQKYLFKCLFWGGTTTLILKCNYFTYAKFPCPNHYLLTCQAIQTMFRIQERIMDTNIQTGDGSFTLSDICLLAEVSCIENIMLEFILILGG